MSKICQVTGRKPSFGNTISHSHRKTRRRWDPNIQKQRFWVPGQRRWVTLRVSAKGIKTIHKKGIEAVLAEMRSRREGLSAMARSNEKRPIIKLRSTEGSGYTYVTRKNRTNTRERIELKKYDPVLRRHVVFREER